MQPLPPNRRWPTPASQMHAGPQGRRQPDIAGNHQHQPPRAADACQVTSQDSPPGIIVVPQHHASDAFGQAGNRRPGVGKAA